MKRRKFRVIFLIGPAEEVYAFNEEQARILAQADRINQGKIYDVLSVEALPSLDKTGV